MNIQELKRRVAPFHGLRNEAGEADGGADGGGDASADGEHTAETATDQTGEAADENAEVIVTIGDDPPPAQDEDESSAPEWVREVRKANRQQAKEIRELKSQLSKANAPAPDAAGALVIGEKPTLEGCDYDGEAFEAKLLEWSEKKRAVDKAADDAKAARDADQAAWADRMTGYQARKAELKVKDYDEAEEAVSDGLSVTQQGIILQGADNPALMIYALGKSPAKLKELAGEKDPVKFAFAVARLEAQVKTTNRKASPPPPEQRAPKSGGASISGSVDSALEKLREDAAKTGDFTKVHAYKRQMKAVA